MRRFYRHSTHLCHSHSAQCRSAQGFTLIELLLYVVSAAILLVLIMLFLSQVLAGRVKAETISEVEDAGTHAMTQILATMRSAGSVNAPAPGTGGASASLNTLTAPENPTVYSVVGGALIVTAGSGAPIALTSNRVIVSDLYVSNLGDGVNPATMRVQFTVRHLNPENKNEYAYTKTFYGSATLRAQ